GAEGGGSSEKALVLPHVQTGVARRADIAVDHLQRGLEIAVEVDLGLDFDGDQLPPLLVDSLHGLLESGYLKAVGKKGRSGVSGSRGFDFARRNSIQQHRRSAIDERLLHLRGKRSLRPQEVICRLLHLPPL